MQRSVHVTEPLSVRSLPLLLASSALSLLPARAGAEGSTLTSEKMGACALLTAADAQRVSNVPMQFEARAPGNASPGRSCAYRPARAGSPKLTVELRLLDGREWSRLRAQSSAGKLEKGIGDEAYVVKDRRARKAGALVVLVRRRTSQFSVRFVGAGVELTDAMKQLARDAAGRL